MTTETTDPVIPPEAVEAAARALYEFSTCDKVAKNWDDGSWRPEVKQTWYDGARLALEAARPHPRPSVEVGTSGLREALERTLGSLPVMTYDTAHHLDPGYRTQAMPKAQLLDLLALHPAHDEAEEAREARWAQMYSIAVDNGNALARELRQDLKVATQVGLELGRREAAEEIARAMYRTLSVTFTADGEALIPRETAAEIARNAATRTADARTDPSGHTDLPPTPDAGSIRFPEEGDEWCCGTCQRIAWEANPMSREEQSAGETP